MAAPAPTRLEEILEDEELSLVFRAFLHASSCSENLSFWIEVELFKTCDESDVPSTVRQIYAKYFSPTSLYELNLDDEPLRRRVDRNVEAPRRTVFDEAQERARFMLETDSLIRFLRSDAYRHYVQEAASRPARPAPSKPAGGEGKGVKDKRLFQLLKAFTGSGRDKDERREPERRPGVPLTKERSDTLSLMGDWREAVARAGAGHHAPPGPSPLGPSGGPTSPRGPVIIASPRALFSGATAPSPPPTTTPPGSRVSGASTSTSFSSSSAPGEGLSFEGPSLVSPRLPSPREFARAAADPALEAAWRRWLVQAAGLSEDNAAAYAEPLAARTGSGPETAGSLTQSVLSGLGLKVGHAIRVIKAAAHPAPSPTPSPTPSAPCAASPPPPSAPIHPP